MLCHRKSASSLSMEASICCKMAFSGIKYLKTLILRPQIDIGSNILLNLAIRHCRIPACTSASRYALCLIGPSSACFRHWRRQTPALGDAHVAACGLQSKGLRPLRCIPRVCRQSEPRKRGFYFFPPLSRMWFPCYNVTVAIQLGRVKKA